jgi:flagellar basal body-associated protein FliL
MADQAKPKTKFSRVIVVILILIVLFCGYVLYKSVSGEGGNSCSSLRSLYESASAEENYGKVSEYFNKMNALGCK